METKWNNFDFISFSDGRARLNVGMSSPSDNEQSSKVLFQISLSNDTIRHSLNLNYHESVELNIVLSKLKDKDFLVKLFQIVATKGTQEFVRNIRRKILRISFFVSREGTRQSKIEIYTNPNDVLEIVTPLSVVLSLSDLLGKYIELYIDINLRVHSIRRQDEVILLLREQKGTLEKLNLNMNNLASTKVQQPVEKLTETSTKSESSLLDDFQAFHSETDISLDIPDFLGSEKDDKKK